jgi:hypothetical protein
MMDRREKIFKSEYGKLIANPDKFFVQHRTAVQAIYNAMDENGKQMCLDLLEYLAKKKVICMSDEDGIHFLVRGESLTREQIFEDFL